MDLANKLGKNKTVLLQIPSGKYNKVIVDILKQLSGKNVCYVTLNKTYSSLQELFKQKKVKVKNILFIDAISNTFKSSSKNEDNCYYCSSPAALTEISLIISKLLKHNFDYLIFDSLTNLMTYHNQKTVNKFIASLVSRIKDNTTTALFYALKIDQHKELIQETSMFVDKTVDLAR